MIKAKSFLLVIMLLACYILTAQVSVTNDSSEADASVMLDVKSTSRGVLIPRMTALERDDIDTPAPGLLVYVSDDNNFYYFNGSSWDEIGANDGAWTVAGNDAYLSISGNVGLGTSIPDYKLDITGNIVADAFRIRRYSDGSETVHLIQSAGGYIQYYNGAGNRGHDFVANDGLQLKAECG